MRGCMKKWLSFFSLVMMSALYTQEEPALNEEQQTTAPAQEEPVLNEEEKTPESVCLPHAQLTLSHHCGRGVGHRGYSSADFFFIKAMDSKFSPFLDARFHVMDDGRFASNTGTGCRFVYDNFSVGGNFYYDFRQSSKLKTHQVAGGLELLSSYVDFRLNGYLPTGGRKYARCRFDAFTKNQINFRTRTHYAFPSVNAEVGIPTPKVADLNTDFYIGVGPYYLFGGKVSQNRYQNSWGGKLRVLANVTEYAGVEVDVNHDNIFKTTYQFVVSFNIPIGKYKACRTAPKGYGGQTFATRVLRPVMRNEIIPVKRKSEIHPLRDSSGNIIEAFFVNNAVACPGLGTFESPFCSFTSIPARPVLIYTFQGTGTEIPNYNTGVTLSPGQILQGSGTPFSIAGLKVPALTSGKPVLSNAAGAVVTLASNTTVRGFTIQGAPAQSSVFGSNVTSVNIADNTFNGGDHGVGLFQPSGNVTVLNNTFYANGMYSVNIDFGTNPGTATIQQNIIYESDGGILLSFDNPNNTALISHNSLFNTTTPVGRGIETRHGTGTITIADNFINGSWPISIFEQLAGGVWVVSDNSIVNTSAAPVAGISYQALFANSQYQAIILRNQVTMVNGNTGIQTDFFAGVSASLKAVQIEDNLVTTTPGFGINISSLGGSPDSICASVAGNTAPRFLLNGSGAPINVQQTSTEYTTFNTGMIFTNIGTVNFGSNCSPP